MPPLFFAGQSSSPHTKSVSVRRGFHDPPPFVSPGKAGGLPYCTRRSISAPPGAVSEGRQHPSHSVNVDRFSMRHRASHSVPKKTTSCGIPQWWFWKNTVAVNWSFTFFTGLAGPCHFQSSAFARNVSSSIIPPPAKLLTALLILITI